MSSKDYDEMERIFCGTWKVDRGENLEEFMTAAEFPEQTQKVILMEKDVSITRDGNSIVEKSTIGGVEFEMRTTLNEVQERKDKDVDPTFHIKTLDSNTDVEAEIQVSERKQVKFKSTFPTYENGVWAQDIIPQNANGGKRHIFKGHVEGDVLIVDMMLPDVPSVTAKKFYKKC